MTTRYKSTAQAAAALAEDPKVEQRVRRQINRNQLVSSLLEMRVSKGITQEQLAELMKCDQSKVSRMEAGHDKYLKWGDIEGYLGAIKVNMHILFDDPSVPAAMRIKQHVFRIHEDLETLAKLAKQVGGQDEIAGKIHQFYGEVLINFLVKFKQSHDKLGAIIKVSPPCPSQIKSSETEHRSKTTMTRSELTHA